MALYLGSDLIGMVAVGEASLADYVEVTDTANSTGITAVITGRSAPSGTINITANGTYDITDYASAEVSISGMGEYELLVEWTASEDLTTAIFSTGDDGQDFADYDELYVEFLICPQVSTTYTSYIKLAFLESGSSAWVSSGFVVGNGISSAATGSALNVSRFIHGPQGIMRDLVGYSANTGSVLNNINYYTTSTTNIPVLFPAGLTANATNTSFDMDDLYTTSDFCRIVLGGYQSVIGTGSQLRIWGR